MVKPGYKQTEIGVIPKDWEVSPAKNLMKIETGSRNTEDKSENGKYLFFVRSQQVEHIDNYHYDCEAVLTAGDGVGTGKVFHYINGKFDAHQRVYVMSQFRGITGRFFYYDFKQNFGQEVFKYTAKSSVDSVRRNMIAEMLIPVPPLEEQKHIAEALSDIDSLIFSLEKLIEKYKSIKFTCLQQMFPQNGEKTPKMRLPGFTGAWEQRKLSDEFSDFIVPMRDKPKEFGGNIPWTRIEDIEGKYLNGTLSDQYVTEETVHKMNLKIIPKDSLIVSSSATFGVIAVVTKNLIINQTFIGLVPNEKETIDYWYAFFHSDTAKKYMRFQSAGSTIFYIARENFENMKIIIPSKDEMIKIGAYFDNLDNLITLHQRKLNKVKKIKQGMMQQLLTGKIRLVTEEKVATAIPVTEQTDVSHSRSGHNQQFDDAIMIAAIVNAFYSDKYPLGRKKVQKLLYLLRRKQEEDTSAFKKKAAGPYADEVRYKGGEPIARKQGYIDTTTTKNGTTFSKGPAINVALSYVDKWQRHVDIDWLASTFKYTKTNDLELYATIDMAICDLQHEGIAVSVGSVKDLIRSNEEWKEKLKKTYFNDENIARAIAMCKRLYQ